MTAPASPAADGVVLLLLSPLVSTVFGEATATAVAPDASDFTDGRGDAPVPEGLRTYLDPSDRVLATCVDTKQHMTQKKIVQTGIPAGGCTAIFYFVFASWSGVDLSEPTLSRWQVPCCVPPGLSFVLDSPATHYEQEKENTHPDHYLLRKVGTDESEKMNDILLLEPTSLGAGRCAAAGLNEHLLYGKGHRQAVMFEAFNSAFPA